MHLRTRLLSVALLTRPNLLGAVALMTAAVVAPSLAHAADAVGAFKAKHEAVVDLVKQNADDAKLQKELDSLLDYGWLAEQSLGGAENFATVCGDRCDEFESLLGQLIRENYLRMVRKAEKHAVEYVGQVEGKNGVYKVTTKIKIDKNGREQTVVVEYVMHQSSDGNWQVRDIITDEVSLAKTYRYEFNKIAKAEGIDGIVRKLEDKLAKLAAEG
jgi:phospholipid transport system substrate-binding protein